jgi:hypothetical protein
MKVPSTATKSTRGQDDRTLRGKKYHPWIGLSIKIQIAGGQLPPQVKSLLPDVIAVVQMGKLRQVLQASPPKERRSYSQQSVNFPDCGEGTTRVFSLKNKINYLPTSREPGFDVRNSCRKACRFTVQTFMEIYSD